MHSEEFKTTILPLKGALYRFAKSFLTNSEEAEDCVQEIFIKLWLKKESLADVRSIKAYTLQMTRNLCLDKLKSRKNMIGIEATSITSEGDTHEDLENRDTLARIQKIVNTLPEQQRTLVHLRNIEGLEMKEIAEITGLSIEHVRVTLSRARMTIRELYQQHYENR